MNVPSTDDAVPLGWEPDHHAPTHFVVRCTGCDRLYIETDRITAIKKADSHGLHCRPVGVTPVRKTGRKPVEFDANDQNSSPAISDGGLDVFETDLAGEELVVRYESVSKRAGEQQTVGEVTAMVPADGADFDYRGFIVRTEDGKRRQVNVLSGEVLCFHDGGEWRAIGDLREFAPAVTADNPRVMTDGGAVQKSQPSVYLAGPVEQADDPRTWREDVKERFPDVDFVDPMDWQDGWEFAPKSTIGRELRTVEESAVLVCNIGSEAPETVGTHHEISHALATGNQNIAVVPEGDVAGFVEHRVQQFETVEAALGHLIGGSGGA